MPEAIGIIPAIMAILVIRMGRTRLDAAIIPAFWASFISRRRFSALVTIRIAFATETPTDMIIPMYDWRFNVAPQTSKVTSEPANTAGMDERIANDNLKD